MKRTFNYTDRKKINRAKVVIHLTGVPERAQYLRASIDLSSLQLPSWAKVYVEAYHRVSYMRFDYGTVSSISPPEKCRLTVFPSGSQVLFRVKIVDESHRIGVILAEAEGISPEDYQQGKRVCILPVDFSENLGDLIWRVYFNGDRPVLEVNKKIEGIKDLVANDPRFFSLVFPAAVSEILRHILVTEEFTLGDTSRELSGYWVQFAANFNPDMLPEDDPDNPGPRLEWIETVVKNFAKKQDLKNKFVRALRKTTA